MSTLSEPAERLEVAQVVAKQALTAIQADRFIFHRHRPTKPKRGVQAISGILKNLSLVLVMACFCSGDSGVLAANPKRPGQSQQITTEAVINDGGVTGSVGGGGGGSSSSCLNRIAQPGLSESLGGCHQRCPVYHGQRSQPQSTHRHPHRKLVRPGTRHVNDPLL